jgi:HTH-type transcriptional regulator, competence development regulator
MADRSDRPRIKHAESKQPSLLGAFIRKARQDVSMTLRDVEAATNNEVSNGYLSQLESGRIAKPSPHILYAISKVLGVNYEALMERAGYILPFAHRRGGAIRESGAKFCIDNLTADEETQLLEYLTFLRTRKR